MKATIEEDFQCGRVCDDGERPTKILAFCRFVVRRRKTEIIVGGMGGRAGSCSYLHVDVPV
jgi:hypothetical protein